MRLADLHTHSTFSDGSDSPSRLVELALALNLTALALTDHDTIAGLAEAQAACAGQDLEFVRGIELSSRPEHEDTHGEVHILGLWLPKEPKKLGELDRLNANMITARQQRNLEILDKLHALGLDLTYADVLAQAGGQVVGRPHLARAMLAKGQVGSLAEAFAKYLGRDGKAYVPRALPSPQTCVQVLADTGALVCLAHPCLGLKNRDKLEALIQSLLPCGLGALEAYHPEHRDADIRFCVDMARKYNLGLSGGSDYHGRAKPGIRLGVGRGNLRVPEMIYFDLKKLSAQADQAQ